MNRNQKWTLVVAAAAVVIGASTMLVTHSRDAEGSKQTAKADVMTDTRVTSALRDANIPIDGLSVRSAGDIVILRGNADPATAEKAAAIVRQLGIARVANLITPRRVADDEGIRRAAERQLATARQLDGCSLHVSCENGIIRVSGTVTHELQKDAARDVLKNVAGARSVEINLSKI